MNYVDRKLKEYHLSPSYIPVAMRNVLGRGLHELKGMIKSARVFMGYIANR